MLCLFVTDINHIDKFYDVWYAVGLIGTGIAGAVTCSVLEYSEHPSLYSVIKGLGLGALCGIALFSTLENTIGAGIKNMREERNMIEGKR